MTATSLEVRSFGVAFGDQVVLEDVSFELPATGMTVLVGPAGCGKSTLVRTIAGLNDGHPSLALSGSLAMGGAPLGAADRPALVVQHARFFLDTIRENLVSALPNRSALDPRTQTRIVVERLGELGLGALADELGRNVVELALPLQRKLAVARALMRDPRVLFADEPTVGLDEADAIELVELLRAQAAHRAVLFVTHNQRYAVRAGGRTLLLAGGRVQDAAPTAEFFSRPRSELAQQFLRTGGCLTPVFGVPAREYDGAVEVAAKPESRSRFVGPRGFFWVRPGSLGGTPRPGIIDPVERDLEGLQRLGVTILVTLEETPTVDPALLAAAGIRSIQFPIPDMGVGDATATLDLCDELSRAMKAGEVVAVHCRAGLGRTGTLLACQLIAEGETARGALDAVRSINPRCVQSDAQLEFLRSFSETSNKNRRDTWH